MALTPPNNGFWRNQLRQWHWISSALCLAGLLLFAMTGFTLNHAADLDTKPKTTRVEKKLPATAMADLKQAADKQRLPANLRRDIKAAVGVDTGSATAEVSGDGVFVDLASPGVDATLTIDPDGHITYEKTTRGLIAVLNDLHKGRHAGVVWSAFIDILAIACVVFAITGFGLLWLYAKGRRVTWPLIAFGILLPFLLFILFVHA